MQGEEFGGPYGSQGGCLGKPRMCDYPQGRSWSNRPDPCLLSKETEPSPGTLSGQFSSLSPNRHNILGPGGKGLQVYCPGINPEWHHTSLLTSPSAFTDHWRKVTEK